MRSNMIVMFTPQINFVPCFVKRSKPMLVKTFVSEFAIETFHIHKHILSRFTRLDKSTFHTRLFAPEEHCLASELCAVIPSHFSGFATLLNRLTQKTRNLSAADGNREQLANHLSRIVNNHIEYTGAPPIGQESDTKPIDQRLFGADGTSIGCLGRVNFLRFLTLTCNASSVYNR